MNDHARRILGRTGIGLLLAAAVGCGSSQTTESGPNVTSAAKPQTDGTQDDMIRVAQAGARDPNAAGTGGPDPAANSDTGNPEGLPMDPSKMTDAEWEKRLTATQYYVTREHGTERAFTGEYWDHKLDGVYKCVCCGQSLFDSTTKYESGTGWPSFYEPMSQESVGTTVDNKLFYTRTEVHCSRCNAHLGHVFDDGPQPTGLRYCINSAALGFDERNEAGAGDE